MRAAALRAEGPDRDRIKRRGRARRRRWRRRSSPATGSSPTAGPRSSWWPRSRASCARSCATPSRGRHGADLRAAADETAARRRPRGRRGRPRRCAARRPSGAPSRTSRADLGDRVRGHRAAAERGSPSAMSSRERTGRARRTLETRADTYVRDLRGADAGHRGRHGHAPGGYGSRRGRGKERAGGGRRRPSDEPPARHEAGAGRRRLAGRYELLRHPRLAGAPGRTADARQPSRGARRQARKRVDHLFPRPEATDWSVKELDYSRRRARVRVRRRTKLLPRTPASQEVARP